jgi:hypothetical protein
VNEPEERSRHSARDTRLGHRCEPRTSRGLTTHGFSCEQAPPMRVLIDRWMQRIRTRCGRCDCSPAASCC